MVQAWSGYNDFYVWFLMLDGIGDQLLHDGIAKARRAVQLQPSAPLAREVLGWTLIKAGRVREGLMHYRASLGMNPHDKVAWKGYGSALIEVGKIREGIDLLKREDGSFGFSCGGQIWLMGYGHFALGEYRAASDAPRHGRGNLPEFRGLAGRHLYPGGSTSKGAPARREIPRHGRRHGAAAAQDRAE